MSGAAEVCPATETLCGWVEGRLEQDDRALLEHHLDGCAACRRAVAEVGRVLGVADANTPHGRAPSAPPGGGARSVGAPRIGRYEIQREIGMGGMGVVYEAFDPSLGRRIALKVLRPDRSQVDRRGQTERLAAEARALAKLSHPNVLTVFDVGVDGDTVFLAAELIEGVTMDAGWPHRARGWRDRLAAYLQAARGLAAIHAAGLTHRDIKPTNILLGDDGRVRITDFGLAVGREERAPPAGTPAYMAPEQLAGEVGPGADQFALAVCMVEAVNGARPPLGSTSATLAEKGRAVWGAAGPPAAVWEVLARALRTHAAERFESVTTFADELESAVEGPGGRAAPSARAAPASRKLASNRTGQVAIAIALLAGGIATASALRAPGVPPPNEGARAASPAVTPSAVRVDAAEAVASEDVASPSSAPAPAPSTPSDPPRPSSPPVGAGAPAIAPPVASIDPSDPLAGLKRTVVISELIRDATTALSARDGKKCLAKLDEVVAIEPSNASGLEIYRGQCEMLVGRCAEGARRIKGAKSLGANAEQLAEMYTGLYCPASSGGSPREQVRSIWLQAGTGKSAESCAAFEAQLERALASSSAEKPGPMSVTGAWSSVGTCWLAVGDCTRARSAALRFIGPEKIDDYMESWMGGVRAERCKR